MAKLITAKGETTIVEPKNGTDFQLEELYHLLDCDMIEIVPASQDGKKILVIDEEGKVRRNPKAKNEIASQAMTGILRTGDYIAGSALFCNSDEVR